jgi:uncharacterized protein
MNSTSSSRLTASRVALLLVFAGGAFAAAPIIDHHQHLLSPAMADAAKGEQPITAEKLIAMLDEAGIERAVVLSNAFRSGEPGVPAAAGEYAKVIAENNWTAAEAAKFPKRLIAFCGIDPLKGYALTEIARCAGDKRFGRGIKLQLGWSMVRLDDAANVAATRAVFAEANKNGLAIVVHLRTRSKWPYGAPQAQVFLNQILPAAPDVTVQIAHLGGGGGGSLDPSAEEALGVFTAVIATGDPRVAHLYFDVAGITGGADTEARAPVIAQRIRELGVEHLLYGSDGGDPSDPPAKVALAAFRDLPLKNRELRAIERNAAPYIK